MGLPEVGVSRVTLEPLVSVVIPVYQSASFIVHALNSALAQTFSHYEVIIVNDGSPDTEILERLLKPYLATLRYIKQENRGPGAARNAAILEARGEYVAFLDSDDFWLPHHLQNLVDLLQKDPSLSLAFSNNLWVEDDLPVGKAFRAKGNSRQPVTFEALLAEECQIVTSSVVARRQAILDIGLFDATLRRCEDFDLWLRMAYRGLRMDYDPGVQLYYRRSSSGLSADAEAMMRAQIAVYEKVASQPISLAQREIIAGRITACQVRLDVEVAKKSLLAREYDAALQSARRAVSAVNSWKLQVAIVGVQYFPHLFSETYRAYRYLLRYRRRAT